MTKYFIIAILLIFSLFFISAGEVRNIEYAFNVSFEPYCVDNICSNQTTTQTDNITNITTNITRETCSSVCYGIVKVDGIYENQLFFEIDIGSERWKNGSSELRYGYKSADLGNLSDISGIRQELQNLTSCFGEHLICTANLTECSTQKTNLDMTVSSKSVEIDELNKKGKEKYIWFVGGILACFVGIKYVLPSIQGKKNPGDPTKEQFPSNAGHQ